MSRVGGGRAQWEAQEVVWPKPRGAGGNLVLGIGPGGQNGIHR